MLDLSLYHLEIRLKMRKSEEISPNNHPKIFDTFSQVAHKWSTTEVLRYCLRRSVDILLN